MISAFFNFFFIFFFYTGNMDWGGGVGVQKCCSRQIRFMFWSFFHEGTEGRRVEAWMRFVRRK